MKKLIVFVAVLVAAMAFLTGCSAYGGGGCGGTAQISRPTPSEGAATFAVEGECTAELNGNVLMVKGSTNLMDGTNGVVSVLASNGESLAEQKVTQQSGEISVEFPVEDDWTDIVYGFITFDTQQGDKQPSEVTDAYGKKFQNLTGDSVIWNTKGISVVFQSESVAVK